jgi:cytochrome b involved in lipid metabolism
LIIINIILIRVVIIIINFKNTQTMATAKEFTYEEVANHNKEDNCWIIIHDKVYDVSKFLDIHPGGADIIMDDAGTDVTTQFEDTGHSNDARKDMLKYEIGIIKSGEIAPGKKSKTSGGGGASSASVGANPGEARAMNPGLVVAGVVLILAVLFVLLNDHIRI